MAEQKSLLWPILWRTILIQVLLVTVLVLVGWAVEDLLGIPTRGVVDRILYVGGVAFVFIFLFVRHRLLKKAATARPDEPPA